MFFFITLLILEIIAEIYGECSIKYNFTEISCLDEDQCFVENATKIHEPVNCFCDPECAVYGDCCADLSKDSFFTQLGQEKIFTCIKNPAGDLPPHLYMYYKCPADWTDDEIRGKCESRDIGNPFHFNPVTSNISGWTYKNIFCALCNNEFEANLTFWGLLINCPYDLNRVNMTTLKEAFDQKLVYYSCNTETWYFDFEEDSTSLPCSTCIYLPPEDINIRGCIPHISKCSQNWTDDFILQKCYNHTAYRYFNGIVYKNEYCAQCNFIDSDKLKCKKPFQLDNTVQYCTNIYDRALPHNSMCLFEPMTEKSCRPEMNYKVGRSQD